MNYRILLAALCLGILVGVTLFVQPEARTLTGSASMDCYVENNLCDCDQRECVCGNYTVPITYCKND